MPTIEDVKDWYKRDLARFAPYDTHVDVLTDPSLAPAAPGDTVPEQLLRIQIYTDVNRYSIVAKEHKPPNGYLGCIASSRKPRAGEDWHRGRDLSDGPLTEETWRHILSDIVSFELVRVHQEQATPLVGQQIGSGGVRP